MKDQATSRDCCIEWPFGVDNEGYALTYINGKTMRVQRLIWAINHGSISNKVVIDHLCRNHKCINIKHLEAVSNKENILRGFGVAAINARKTHCKRGHILEGNNLMILIDGRGCRICRRMIWKTYRDKKIIAKQALKKAGEA